MLRPRTSTSGGQSAGIVEAEVDAEGGVLDPRADAIAVEKELVVLLEVEAEDADEPAGEEDAAVILVNARHSDADVQVRHLMITRLKKGQLLSYPDWTVANVRFSILI